MGTFSNSRRVGGKISGQRVGIREAALNFLDFFASFCVKTKMKTMLGHRRKCLQAGKGFEIIEKFLLFNRINTILINLQFSRMTVLLSVSLTNLKICNSCVFLK